MSPTYKVTKTDNSYSGTFTSLEEAQSKIKSMTCEGLLFDQNGLMTTPCGCQFKIEKINSDGSTEVI